MFKLSRLYNYIILSIAIKIIRITWDITKRNQDIKNDAILKTKDLRFFMGPLKKTK